MIFTNKINILLPSIFMLAFLCICLIVSLSTISIKHTQILDDIHVDKKEKTIINGRWAAAFEKSFEENMLIRDIADNIWGGLSFGLFETGKSNVVIGKNGWLFSKEEFDDIPNANKNEARFIQIVKEVNAKLLQNDIAMTVVIIPSKIRIYPEYAGKARLPNYRYALYQNVVNQLQDYNISVIDLETAMMGSKNQGQLYLSQDTHWTPLGAKVAAKAIADAVDLTLLDKVNYQLQKNDNKSVEGDLKQYISTDYLRLWLRRFSETIPQFKLIESPNTKSKNIFDDEVIPVALIGTSYSAIADWQFENMLKYSLQADVVNMANEGQGPLAPMQKFLKNTDLKTTTLKLVIWEIPERFIPVHYADVKFEFEVEAE